GNNQRLEHLGDTLLKFHFPYHHEGHLSILRNTMANKYTQGQVVRDLGLTEFIIEDTPGRTVALLSLDADSKIFADVLESFVGAVFVDKDLTWVERLCQVCFFPRLVEFILTQEWNDPKSKLQQCCLTLRDRTASRNWPATCWTAAPGAATIAAFESRSIFANVKLGEGSGKSRKNQDSFPVLQFHQQVIEQRYSPSLRASMLARSNDNDAALVTAFTMWTVTRRSIRRPTEATWTMSERPAFDDEEEAADADKDCSVDGVGDTNNGGYRLSATNATLRLVRKRKLNSTQDDDGDDDEDAGNGKGRQPHRHSAAGLVQGQAVTPACCCPCLAELFNKILRWDLVLLFQLLDLTGT
uniref:RNase III domain-containing protein n=1 Tax=Macrostomum lignano TaxID=282301 RepID=A0A1I8FKM0_9PLAT